MDLIGMFRRATAQREPRSQPRPPLDTGRRRFERDPARMFDPGRTAALARLFAVPPERRDGEWVARFWDAAWTAVMVVPDPAFCTGPDGFPYLRLVLPAEGVSYQANCLMNVAAGLVEQGSGAAFFASPEADADAAEFVVSMGVLDSILRFDDPDGDPADLEDLRRGRPAGGGAVTLEAGEQVLIGTPSPDFLSPAAARALHRLLVEQWDLQDPCVSILVSHALNPTRSLVVGRSRAALLAAGVTDAEIAGRMRRLAWFLPPGRGLMLMPDDWSVAEMTPLKQLF